MIAIGDIVKLPDHDMIGMVVDRGERKRRLYGDGLMIESYVSVKWFDKKYDKVAQYSPSVGLLEVVSESGK